MPCCSASLGGVFSGIALVHIRKLDRVAGDLLHLFGQRGDLLTVAFRCSGDLERQQVSEAYRRRICTFEPLRRFAPS